MMEGWGRRQFLCGTLGLLAAGRACPAEEGRDQPGPSSLMQRSWRLDPSCVLPRGQARIYFNSGPYGHEQMYSLVAGS